MANYCGLVISNHYKLNTVASLRLASCFSQWTLVVLQLLLDRCRFLVADACFVI